MARVFEIDVLQCERCGQKGMQRVAFITDGSAIKAILQSVGLATAPPDRKHASLSELTVQGELGFETFDQSVFAGDDCSAPAP